MTEPSGGGDPPGGSAVNALVAMGLLVLLLIVLLALQVARHGNDVGRWAAGWMHRFSAPLVLDRPPAAPALPAPEKQADHYPRPAAMVGNPAEWFSDDFYPPSAKQKGLEGRVSVVLRVDADGTVSDCTVVMSSGVAVLDQATCSSAIQNGRFSPALDDKGKPVASDVKLPPVRWQLRDE